MTASTHRHRPLLTAHRVAALGGEGSFRVLAAARTLEAAGADIIHLEFGEPDFSAPPHVVRAGITALESGATKYVSPAGIPALRSAIANAATQRDIRTSAQNVFVTSGAKPALLYAALAVVNPGDEVLVPDPGFPIYSSHIRLAGGTPVSYPIVRTDTGWTLDFDALRAAITPRTRALWLNSPSNPVGWVATTGELIELAMIAIEHNLWIVSDEIYDGLTYDAHRAPSIAALPGLAQRTIVVDGFSKRYAMTGWRLGFAIVPDELRAAFDALIVNSTSCAPHFVQQAGLAALEGPQECIAEFRESFRVRRDTFAATLADLPGVSCPLPSGAFYLFADVRELLERTGFTSRALADHLLDDAGVALLPGTDFGALGEGFLRFSIATAPALLADAGRRIAASLERIPAATLVGGAR